MNEDAGGLDPTTPEFITRELFCALLLAESRSGFDFTETMLWMALGANPGGLSINEMAKTVSRDRATVRRRLNLMSSEGLVKQDDGLWFVTDAALVGRAVRFREVWDKLPARVQDMIMAESERRKVE